MTTTNEFAIYDTLAAYGVSFEGEQGPYIPTEDDMTLGELAARGGKIARVRWVGGDYIPGRGKCYDISYVHGVLPDGTRVSIHDVWDSLVPRYKMKAALVEIAKEAGVYAKGIGLLDESVWSILG